MMRGDRKMVGWVDGDGLWDEEWGWDGICG